MSHIVPSLDPRRSGQKNSIGGSGESPIAISPPNTPSYPIHSPLYQEHSTKRIETNFNTSPAQPTFAKPKKKDTKNIPRMAPRPECDRLLRVQKIVRKRLVDDLIRYDCIIDGKKQSANPNKIDPLLICKYENSDEKAHSTIVFNKYFKRPIPDKIRLVTSLKKHGVEKVYVLLRYENDFNQLVTLKEASKKYSFLLEEYFKRTLFA